mmetsp:Transcript_30844/g.86450  ORF Transcript_30844/g.86450 Transcript_30844/m.86450 type:complete len:80 (-) Transcript_30844:25-264(-)
MEEGVGQADVFDRHPKVCDWAVIGSNATVLGNIRIGINAKVGASAVVLKSVEDGKTATGTYTVVSKKDLTSGLVDVYSI